MNGYGIAMFVHMIGLIALFGGLVIVHHGGTRLRAASTWEDARTWLGLLRPIRGMFIAGGVFLLASGMYMARVEWSFGTPWVVVGTIVVLLFLATGALVSGRIFARIGRASAQAKGPISDEARALIRSPLLWSSTFGMNGGALGMVWLMTTKPGWTGSIGIPLAATVLGSLIGLGMTRSGRARAVGTHAHAPAGTT